MLRLLRHHPILIITFLTIIGGCLRFYNLNWGAPYYFHPDERNVAFSLVQLHFPDQLNPNFFAYGSLPIYVVYFTGLLYNLLFKTPDISTAANIGFDQAIIISRFYSAVFSTLLLPLIYILGKKLHSSSAGILAAVFVLFSVGLIQFAHFGTFEMWITFFSVLLFSSCISLFKSFSSKKFILTSIIAGVLLGIKVSNAALLFLPLLPLIMQYPLRNLVHHKRKLFSQLLKIILYMVLLLFISALVYFMTNPFVALSYDAFRGSMRYESGVALGTIPVFYTHEFYGKLPVIFQFLHVYPFLLNPLMTIIFPASLLYFLFHTAMKKNKVYALLIAIFFSLFLSQAFLFVKWTRYMVPTLPFIYLIIAITLLDFIKKTRYPKSLPYLFLGTLTLVSCIFTTSYVASVLGTEDTRITARKWAAQYFERDAYIATEIYDLGIVPFNEISSRITLCDFYSLETNQIPCNGISWQEQSEKSTYIVLPSQRIIKSRMTNPKRYPEGHKFYSALLQNKTEFKKVYETPCDIFCKVTYLGSPVYTFEQTANVFDRPTVYIFEKKNK